MSYHVQASCGYLATVEDYGHARVFAATLSNGLITEDIDIPAGIVIVQDTQPPYGVSCIFDSGIEQQW